VRLHTLSSCILLLVPTSTLKDQQNEAALLSSGGDDKCRGMRASMQSSHGHFAAGKELLVLLGVNTRWQPDSNPCTACDTHSLLQASAGFL
jgi:hypothetical protein